LIEESTRRGDWKAAENLAGQLPRLTLPSEPEELCHYLHRLRETIVIARSARAHMLASLHRINAAAGFCRLLGAPAEERQNFVDSAEVYRPAKA